MRITSTTLYPYLCSLFLAFASSVHATDYYVACNTDTPSGDGSQTSPWTSLDQVNANALAPGDNLLFIRGYTCTGTLQPIGEGSPENLITIGASGTGNLPIIDGNGEHNAVLLENMSNVTIQDLEITNATNPGTERNGIRVNLVDYGESQNITLQNLTIHTVRGGDVKSLTGSAGILISVSGDKKASWYDNLQILNNKIYDVDREGIYFKSLWNKRPEVGTQDTIGVGPWTPSTGVIVRGNHLSSIAGDGIKVDTTQGAIIDGNTVAGFQLRSKQHNAGIWTFNTNDTLVENNEVSGGGNSLDGMSFDADGGSINTIFQYNYSHNNVGGLLLICPYSGAVTNDTVMRYNLSYNDKTRLFQVCAGSINNTKIYNNTIWNDGDEKIMFFQNDKAVNVAIEWANNIVQNSGPEMAIAKNSNQALSFYNNNFIGVQTPDANPDGQIHPGAMSIDPQFVGVDPKDVNGFKVRKGSPIITQGKIISDNGGYDYYQSPVSATTPPNIGAYEGSGM